MTKNITHGVNNLIAGIHAMFAFCLLMGGVTVFAQAVSVTDAESAGVCEPPGATLKHVSSTVFMNRCPLANAGQNLHIMIDQPIPLDASKSSDMDGQALTFYWQLAQSPPGSGARIDNPHSLTTEFTADLAGEYEFTLTVKDSAGATSVDTVRFSTGNVAPVANTGPDLSVALGELVLLDAGRSFDLNEATQLTYHWRLLEQPPASRSNLHGQSESRGALLIDADGDYLVELVVSDGKLRSQPDTLRISTKNSIPVAQAGRSRTLAPKSTLILNGDDSHDADGDALAYHWSVLHAPDKSSIKIDDPSAVSPAVQLGNEGLYLFQLMIDDGVHVSSPSTVLINVDSRRLTDYNVNDFLSLTTRGGGDDTDGDGVLDPVDNCVLVANAPQRDTDGDGIGNYCDPDLNNDGVVNFLDIGIWQLSYLGTDPDADFNGDGNVNFLDYSIITSTYLMPPGPPGTIIWVSLVDGDWDESDNWDPQVVPTAGVNAIIDLGGTDVTVTLANDSAMVKNLVQNEALVLSSATFEATGAVELGGTITGTTTTISNTQFVPSQTGTGTITLNSSSHTWSSNTLGVNTTMNNGALINNSDGMLVNATLQINAPSSATGVQFVNDQTFGGTGTIVFNGAGNSVITEPRLFPSNFTTLTIAPGLTIRGGNATIGNPNADLVLSASLDADVSDDSLWIRATTWSSTGSFTAQNGGNIQLGGNFDNAGSVLSLDTAGGSINLLNGAALRNTTIAGQTGTVLSVNTGSTTLENVVMNADMVLVNGALSNVTSGLTINGDVLIDAPSSPTGFQFTNDQTLAGTSTITLDGVGNSILSEPRIFPFNFTTLTIAPGISIRGGKGTIGNPNADLILSGDVSADVGGETLRIMGSTWSSTATLTASNGGALELSNIFDNGGNTLNLDTAGGSINLLNGASLRNTTINGTAGTNLTINTGSTTFQAVTLNADMNFVNGALTNVSGGLTINGDVLIDAPSSPTGFQFIESQTLGGTMTITIDALGNSIVSEPRLFPFNFTTLTIGPDVTIRGGNATIGNANATLVLLGDLIADVSGEEFVIGGSSWSANSLIQTINDGEVRFFGTMDNGGSALNIDAADGQFSLTNGVTLTAATFNGTAGTEMLVPAGSTTFNTMTFNHDVTHQNGALTTVSGGLTINGTALVQSPSSPTGYQFAASQTLAGNLSIIFDSAGNSVITEPRLFPFNFTTLTIDPTVTISGSKATIGNVNAALVINGTIDADVNGQTVAITGTNWNGTGTLGAHNGGAIQLSGSLNNADQTLNFDTAAGSLIVTNGTALKNANLAGTPGTDFSFLSGSHTFENLVVNADMTFNNGALASVTAGLTVNGDVLIDAPSSPTGMNFLVSQTLGGSANIVIDGVGNGIISEPRLFPTNFTTLTIGSGVTISGGKGTIGNPNAALVINGAISADVETINVIGNAVTNNGLLEALNGQTLSVDNLAAVNGDLHAGAGSNILLLDTLILTPGSDVFIDIAGPSSVGTITADVNSSTYAGTITISAVDSYMPNVSDSFALFSHAAGFTGSFPTVNSVGLGIGESFGLTYGPGSVVATVN
ncbi:MAG: hypothetical protein HKN70_04440 [Gammaproteobacteria bacterium]|nr:hypothetical protein [Gammaproteobacteria bacterium]